MANTPTPGPSDNLDNNQASASDAQASPDQTAPRQPVRASLRIRDATKNNDQTPDITPANNSASENTPLFGSLRARNAMFYFKASVTQLKRIIASTPQELREQLPSPANKEALVNEVIRLREKEAMTSQQSQDSPLPSEACLKDLLSMSAEDISNLIQNDPATLRTIMTSALQADSSLTPREIPSQDGALEITVLKWQLQAHRAASNNENATPHQRQTSTRKVTFQDQQTAPGQVAQADTAQRPLQNAQNAQIAAPRLIAEPAPPRQYLPTLADLYAVPQPSHSANRGRSPAYATIDSSDEEDFIRPRRKKSETPITPKNFTVGASSALDDTLSVYPGKIPGANSLNVDELLGPHILATMIAGGQDVPTFLNRFAHWKKTPNGIPSHAEMEAFCLGRIIHLLLLRHASPKEALENSSELEVALRRLFALMYVEQKTNTGAFKDKGVVWREIDYILESSPVTTVSCDPITEEMTRRMNMENKRITASKAIAENRNRNRSNGNNRNNGFNRNNGNQKDNNNANRPAGATRQPNNPNAQ